MSASLLAPRQRQSERQGCLQPPLGLRRPPAGPLRSREGRRAHGRPNSARDRPWPTAWRCPRGARYRPAQGITSPGCRRGQGSAYSPQTQPRRASPGEKAGDEKRPRGPLSRPEEALERGLRPRPTPTVASALPWRRSGRLLSKPGAPPPARPSPTGQRRE